MLISEAAQIIKSTVPTSAVAALYGYTDPNYVSRLYRQLFGYNITDRPNIHPELP